MYLVHVGVRAPFGAARLAPDVAGSIRALAEADEDGPVEHVSAHPYALPDPVVGVYVLADTLGEAERRTEALCRRAVRDVRALRGWHVTGVGVPLLAPYLAELARAVPGAGGRIGPGPFPSTRKPFRPL
ncbi:hypothetical protein [Streptomyces sp. NPDC048606]|uniref:hypothetical protein n=1 Tax=Streptomyces sp. NPDC048606 TaxID=3154726 RepID=UPI00341670BE